MTWCHLSRRKSLSILSDEPAPLTQPNGQKVTLQSHHSFTWYVLQAMSHEMIQQVWIRVCVCVCFSHELCYCHHVFSRHGNLSFTSQHPKHQDTTKAMMSDLLQIVKYVIDSDIAPACVRNSTCHCQRQCQSLDCVALPSLRGGPALIWNGSAVVVAHLPIVIDQWHSWQVIDACLRLLSSACHPTLWQWPVLFSVCSIFVKHLADTCNHVFQFQIIDIE